MAIDPKNKREAEEIKVFIEDTLMSISSKITSSIRDAVEEAADGVDANILKGVGNDVSRVFKEIVRASNETAGNTTKLSYGLLTSRDITKQQLALDLKREKLGRKLQRAALYNLEIDQEELNNANKALDAEQKQLDSDKERTDNIAKATGNLGELFSRLAKNKFFGSLLNAEEGLVRMRKKAFDLSGTKGKGMSKFAKTISIAKSGFSGLISGFTKALGPIALLVKGFQLFVGSLFRADELNTSFAKTLGISKELAEGQLTAIQQTTGYLEDTSYVTEDIAKATGELVGFQGAFLQTTRETVKQQAFLTKFIGLQGEEAALLNTVYENQGTNAEIVYDQINATANEAAKLTGNFVSADSILREIGKSSASVLANFGFSTKELSNAVLQTRRFGVSLGQASNIAGGLLDFEQSIASELEAEILLGKQFNFERARALAATGDIAGATEEVLKQTQNLSDEQLRSPIIQQSLAKATGLNADELVRSIQLTRALNKSQGQYDELLKKAATKAERRQIQEGILQGASAKQIQKNLTAQQQFNNAIANAKDQFAAFVDGGFLDQFAAILPGVLDKLAFLSGTGDELKAAREAKNLEKKAANITDAEGKKILDDEQAKRLADAYKADEAYKRSMSDILSAGSPMGGLQSWFINNFGLGTGFKRSSTDESQAVHNTLKDIHSELKKSGVINLDEQAFINRVITYDTK